MPTLLVRHATILVTMDSQRREIPDGGFFVRDGFVTGMGSPYEVRVASGGLGQIGDYLLLRGLTGGVGLVSDENVAPLYAASVLESLEPAGFTARSIIIPAGEAFKTVATIQDLWTAFLSAGLERSSTVLAMGGGVVSDLAGFAASAYLRGVRWVGIPTTLLAMIDASLGGKTGVDLPQGKNLVGAFHPPALILVDPAVLGTLPEAELRSGAIRQSMSIKESSAFNCHHVYLLTLPHKVYVKITVTQE